MFEHLATRWPFFNRTIAGNVTRHILLTPCDHGPGDCFFDRVWTSRRGDPLLPEWLRPSNPQRLVSFMTPTGAGGAFNYFLPGVDIRLPQVRSMRREHLQRARVQRRAGMPASSS
eukprot:2965628-Prymnesium_polylepis.1